MAGVYTVAQMNSYIKNMFRQDFVLSRVDVRGEVSNCKYHTSGHIYFTLKDESGTLAAVMFAGQAKNLSFRLENGMKVVVSGRIDVYERDGKYQIYVNNITADGIGDLYKKFEELKSYYEEMGYFSNEYKRPIPQYASRIGIVTASTGAAIHDILNIAHRRNPYVSLTLYPALVQGKNAAQSIAQGIRTLDAMNFDVIIVGRGGGSIEDLWAFNEEPVIEAVFNSNTPVISAVGHETDFTITDFVADLRAPTPSAAAELAVSDISVTQSRIEGYMELLNQLMERKLYMYRSQLENKKLKLEHLSPMTILDSRRHQLIQTGQRMENAMNNILLSRKHQLEIYASKLHGLLNKGNQFVDILSNSTEEQYFELKQSILMDLSLVYTQLYGYYGQMVDRGSVISEEQLIEQMESLSMYVNENRRYALFVMLAKIQLLRQNWQGAASSCEEVIASGAYRLEPLLNHTTVSSSESKEVIYGDFHADGKYIHPLLYREVLIIAAYANFKKGTINKALQFANELLASYGMVYTNEELIEGDIKKLVAKLYGTGQSYPYARILSMKFGVNGFETPKNWFLPVPESALLSCPNLQQNPGY